MAAFRADVASGCFDQTERIYIPINHRLTLPWGSEPAIILDHGDPLCVIFRGQHWNLRHALSLFDSRSRNIARFSQQPGRALPTEWPNHFKTGSKGLILHDFRPTGQVALVQLETHLAAYDGFGFCFDPLCQRRGTDTRYDIDQLFD